jgi:ElaB/YqjD/DUF883 family membrane-anchored ribosome-binding protein
VNRRADLSAIGNAGEQILSNLGGFVEGAEDLLRATRHISGEGLAAARAKFEDQLEDVREAVKDAEAFAREQATRAVKSTDKYVHRNPWQAVGIAAGVGLVLGFLSARR